MKLKMVDKECGKEMEGRRISERVEIEKNDNSANEDDADNNINNDGDAGDEDTDDYYNNSNDDDDGEEDTDDYFDNNNDDDDQDNDREYRSLGQLLKQL